VSKRKEWPAFNLEAWETDLYRKCLMAGHWQDVDALFPGAGRSVPAAVYGVLVKAGRKKEPMDVNDVELSEETKALLERRTKAGCVSCQYILDDWAKNNKLTDYGNYPPEAKINHIEAEKAGEVV
jgi:hypothetical protein